MSLNKIIVWAAQILMNGQKSVYSCMQEYKKEDSFELPIEYKGSEMLLPAKLVQMGYTYKIFVEVMGNEIVFEPDEERNFRAIVEASSLNNSIPVEMLKAISESIEKHLR